MNSPFSSSRHCCTTGLFPHLRLHLCPTLSVVDTRHGKPPCVWLGRAVIVAASGAIFRIEPRSPPLSEDLAHGSATSIMRGSRGESGKLLTFVFFRLAESGIKHCSTTTLFFWYGKTLRSLLSRAV